MIHIYTRLCLHKQIYNKILHGNNLSKLWLNGLFCTILNIVMWLCLLPWYDQEFMMGEGEFQTLWKMSQLIIKVSS